MKPFFGKTKPGVPAFFLGLLTFLISHSLSGNAIAQDQTGLAIGSKAPEFTLKDQNGQDQSLQTMLKKGPVALVFHRSADW
jgi:cytochrome oxidase Cu insertion factor (SCO1/SenC/PrrC family)